VTIIQNHPVLIAVARNRALAIRDTIPAMTNVLARLSNLNIVRMVKMAKTVNTAVLAQKVLKETEEKREIKETVD
jgi:hypothetical protein